jgi:hypothetical protein
MLEGQILRDSMKMAMMTTMTTAIEFEVPSGEECKVVFDPVSQE